MFGFTQCDTSERIHHSDRDCQYTRDAYQTTLKTLGGTCSKSRRGRGCDNAVMERFFSSLKREWTKFESFADITESRMSVFRYIETFYNSERIHQTLDHRTPNQFEAEHLLNSLYKSSFQQSASHGLAQTVSSLSSRSKRKLLDRSRLLYADRGHG